MARFQINDTIELIRHNREVVRRGTVVAGPWLAEKVNHYHVKWEWTEDDNNVNVFPRPEVDLICDWPSKKYHYRLAD